MINKTIPLILFCFSLFLFADANEFTTKSGLTISLEVCQEKDLIECEIIFISAFSKAYEELSPQDLGVEDKLAFLLQAFSDVYEDVRLNKQKVVVAKIEGTIIGFAGFTKTEIPNQIYISQLAVNPQYWNQGIGRHLVFSALNFYENVHSLVVISRRINHMASSFYRSLGFIESSYMHPEYNPQRYVGYELIYSR